MRNRKHWFDLVVKFRVAKAAKDVYRPHQEVFFPHRANNAKGESGCALPFCVVRPAWAHSYGCKSRHKLVTASEVKRNCMRATECGEEAWSESAGR